MADNSNQTGNEAAIKSISLLELISRFEDKYPSTVAVHINEPLSFSTPPYDDPQTAPAIATIHRLVMATSNELNDTAFQEAATTLGPNVLFLRRFLLKAKRPPTSFGEWWWQNVRVQPNGECKTTLEAELLLARHLYDEAEGPPDKSLVLSVEELIQTLQSGTFIEEDLVRWKGISVDWFLHVFSKTKFVQRLIEFDCQLWFVRKVCIIELLRCKGAHNSGALIDHVESLFLENQHSLTCEITKEPTVFLSYTGRYKFSQFMELLGQLEGQYIWMDIFCVDQFAWTGKSRSPQMKACRDRLVDDLQGNIAKINNTVLLLEHWNNTISTLKQIWVLWEVFNTVESRAKFSILLGPIQKQKFLRAINTSNQDELKTVMTNLSKIDCDKALADNDEDRAAILTRMKKVGLHRVSKQATEMVRDWLCSVITNHAKSLLASSKEPSADMVYSIAQSINNVAVLLMAQGKLDEALPLYEKALASCRQVIGDSHPDTLKSINNMAVLLEKQGKLDEALLLLEEALAGNRQVLGDRHPDTLLRINNMASILIKRGKWDEALLLLEEALAGQRQVLGDRHTDTLKTISNLAFLLRIQGQLDEALSLYEEALTTMRQVFGDRHPDTLLTINNMALLLQEQGKLDEALPLYEEAVVAYRQVLGDRHPETLMSILSMGTLLTDQGKLDEALLLLEEALATQRQVFGDRHPHTLLTINSMANLLQKQGKWDGALSLYEEALATSRQVLGDRHPDTLLIISNMAGLLNIQESKWDEALLLHKEVLAGQRQMHGDNHPNTLRSMSNMAALLSSQGKLDEALLLFEKALAGQRQLLGNRHPHTLLTINNMANLLQKQEKLDEALSLYEEALAVQKDALGNRHPDTLLTINNRAILSQKQGKLDEALPLYEEAVVAYRQVLGDRHPETLMSIFGMGTLLMDQGKLDEALVLLEEALSGFLEAFGPEHPSSVMIQESIRRCEELQQENNDRICWRLCFRLKK